MKPWVVRVLKAILAVVMLGVCTVAFAGKAKNNLVTEPTAFVGYTVGGTVSGLLLGNNVVLQNNDGNDLIVDANGSFTFTNKLPNDAPYDVTVLIQPTVSDNICNVKNGNGTIDGSDVTDVLVDCISPPESNCPGGSGNGDILIMNHDYDSGTVIDCTAANSITLEGVSITNGTTLNLQSNSILFGVRIAIELGSQFYVFVPGPIRLNDTGIVTCGDDGYNSWLCPVATHPSQDGDYGRDVTHNDDSDGHAGFSFIKIDANGNTLPSSATSWSCVRDNVTGLTWEVKTDDRSIHDSIYTYTWYNPDSNINGGDAGRKDGGSCRISSCDTHGYVRAVNAQGLCGAVDWRMPTAKELLSITSIDRFKPVIDTDYFPNTPSEYHSFWSAVSHADSHGVAWYVHFGSGGSGGYTKSSSEFIRLVRGGQWLSK